MKFIMLIGLYCLVQENLAQFDGFIPQRPPSGGPGPIPRPIQIPGAIPVGGGSPARGRVVQQGGRRPSAAPGFFRPPPNANHPPPPPQFSTPISQSKPVTEEPEEDNYPPRPSFNEDIEQQIAQKEALLAQFGGVHDGPGISFPQPSPSPIVPIQFRPEPPKPQVRPQPQRVPQPIRPEPARQIIQQAPVQQARPRPAPRPAPQQIIPQQRNVEHSNSGRRDNKKPVAQIIRKYQEQNPDGSITWGYENDDGSFKEETIGNDCITRGKYGYVDPDGLKREYNYETGLPCDTVPQEEDEPSVQQVPTNQQPRRPRPN